VRSVLIISDRDNVATALEPLAPGRRIDVKGGALTVQDTIPSGHKIALVSIPAGEAVVKYGSPIGVATAAIPPGAHVHTHNVSSNRGRGDLPAAPLEPEPRLAEPPDDRNGVIRDGGAAREVANRAAGPEGES
jgi:altronate dehydratase